MHTQKQTIKLTECI